MKREAYDVIVAPVVTEKTTAQMDRSLYTFVVATKANKHEIVRAVESLWDVKVKDVRTMRYPGRAKRALLGRMAKNMRMGRVPSYKKAVVQLADGDEIDFYEAG